MTLRQYYELPEFSAILSFIDAVFSEINMGLFIYHLERADDAGSLKLLYANKEASKCTGVDLHGFVGKYILEAFPNLGQTDIPEVYREVATSRESRHVGVVDYQDANLDARRYGVRAFPMPSDCVGILFEEIENEVAAPG